MSFHVVAVQGAAPVRANAADRAIFIVAQEVNALAVLVGGMEIDIAIAILGRRLAGMAAGAVVRKYLLSLGHGAGAEFMLQLRDQLIAALQFARCIQIGWPLRKEERRDVRQTVFNGAEVRTITPALGNVERRLPESAIVRIKDEKIGEMVLPAGL